MQRFKEKIPFYLLLMVAGSMVLPVPINSICIVLFAVSAFLNFSFRKFPQQLRFDRITLFSVLVYLTVVCGVLLSDNKTEAWHYAERKLSLLIFPLAFMFIPALNNKQLLSVFKTFVSAVLMAGLYALSAAFFSYLQNASTESFFYHQLSSAIHFNAIYFSAYCLFSFILVIQYSIFGKLKLPVLILLTVLIMLLSSKMVIALFLLSLLLLIKEIKLPFRKKIYGILSVLVSAGLILWLTPFLRQRIITELQSDTHIISQHQFAYNTPFSGSTLRTVLWRHSLSILSEQQAWLTGVGTGDFQFLLDKKYAETGMYMGNPRLGDSGYKGYNPHNQYIEFILAQGIIGLFLWLMWIIFLWQESRTSNHFSFTLLLVFVGLLSMTECFLSANKGIVWFVFFCMVFINQNKQSINQQ